MNKKGINWFNKIKRRIKYRKRKIRIKIVTLKRNFFVLFRYLFVFPTISVIIPTYRVEFLTEAIDSVFKQEYPISKIEVIVVINGKKKDEIKSFLKENYNNNIKIFVTEKIGASNARNIGIEKANNKYLIFLDDDDMFTKNLIRKSLSKFIEKVEIVAVPVLDFKNEKYEKNNYINDVIYNREDQIINNLLTVGPLFSTICAKVYKRKLFYNFCLFNTDFTNSEDVIFWVDNFNKLNNDIYIQGGQEFYIRRITTSSLSRPDKKTEYNFFVNDRIKIINYLQEKIFSKDDCIKTKIFILRKINGQFFHIKEYYQKQNKIVRNKIKKRVLQEESIYVKKDFLFEKTGIAFCHNFSPFSDPSSIVATKRLLNFSNMVGENIKWQVICGDMSNCREKDEIFDMFFAKYLFFERTIIDGNAYFNEKSQYNFGKNAFKAVSNIKVDYIYSRSMWSGSHIAAFLYKKRFPEVVWIAEFSDPIYKDSNNEIRKPTQIFQGTDKKFNNYWWQVENDVYENADKIIFTNDYQLKYMINYNKKMRKIIQKKSLVLPQPTLEKKYCYIYNSDYKINENKINIAYFGSFYANRNLKEINSFLENEKICFHLFVPEPEKIKNLSNSNVRINKFVSYFEFLNICTKMDYLYLNDIAFPGNICPYLPSKLADYFTSDTKIIAKIEKNTILDKFEHDNLMKINSITKEFVTSLKKQEKN